MTQTTLLIIDMQQAFEKDAWGERNNPHAEEKALQVLQFFRKHKLPICHIQHVSSNPCSLFYTKQGQAFKNRFEPIAGEIIFQKTVNSAFIGTGLEQYLHEQKVSQLVIVGLTLPHCISTTTRMASNLGFKVTLLADATASFSLPDRNGQLVHPDIIHNVNLISLQNEFAQILDTDKFLTYSQNNPLTLPRV
ncbi:cysteine hydrolase family protein [Streptococcus oralis]|uniref:Isochorismatase n=1 Tax=Streptococcus oralis TaxID=1303 RepID=A0A139QSI8_STROR|nr:cysteine hydrolase family protein [Streptococcus oralis]KXU05311.1 Isochorismatase [Streptococcus oralis]